MNIDLPLDGRERTVLREASRTLYGNMHVMETLLVIGRSDRDLFYQAGLANDLGCKANQAGAVIEKLLQLGVAERVPREEGQARGYCRRLPSALWSSVIPFAIEVLQQRTADVAKLADHRPAP
ncbi:MAG: hypothetical protein ABW167_16745 [Baekduia sp.]